MKKIILPLLILLVIFTIIAMAACSVTPAKHSTQKFPLCSAPSDTGIVRLNQAPYTKLDPLSCAVAIIPTDVAVWNEAAFNSRKIRNQPQAELGCKPLLAKTDDCSYCGPTGHSNTMVMSFDATVFPEGVNIRKAFLAVYTPDDPQGLNGAVLRGRYNIGDEMQSLARNREAVVSVNDASGWVFFDISFFMARAINERRNSIHFELSLPCQTPATNLVRVGVTSNEPHLVVEYN